MTNQSNDPAHAKGTIRSRLLAARRACAPERRAAWSSAACEVLVGQILVGQVGAGGVVAAYASFGTEPDTGPLLAGLRGRGIRVLLPILENDMDLSWGYYSGPDSLVRRIPPGGSRPSPIPEPAESLGVDAVLSASWIVVPALAVSPSGHRMGRGGGSYDRVLARIEASPRAVRPRVAALLYPGELDVDLPLEPHDRPVDMAVAGETVRHWDESPGEVPSR
ncbi:5-formyltetrahydrofolate cyclo-ligase [Catenulispora pinisilvae]|uniref:5-formyltetrahydrofolate cyclo-ligase n=1 Tax=Catenulispora pinisilvae TaxID=2705253 RepID=UPI0018917FA1|nr:5-formyltetrahydrofolate cyclo-ligase [Catenulispora pinisilvae]